MLPIRQWFVLRNVVIIGVALCSGEKSTAGFIISINTWKSINTWNDGEQTGLTWSFPAPSTTLTAGAITQPHILSFSFIAPDNSYSYANSVVVCGSMSPVLIDPITGRLAASLADPFVERSGYPKNLITTSDSAYGGNKWVKTDYRRDGFGRGSWKETLPTGPPPGVSGQARLERSGYSNNLFTTSESAYGGNDWLDADDRGAGADTGSSVITLPTNSTPGVHEPANLMLGSVVMIAMFGLIVAVLLVIIPATPPDGDSVALPAQPLN
jgi:hypothetical protein